MTIFGCFRAKLAQDWSFPSRSNLASSVDVKWWFWPKIYSITLKIWYINHKMKNYHLKCAQCTFKVVKFSQMDCFYACFCLVLAHLTWLFFIKTKTPIFWTLLMDPENCILQWLYEPVMHKKLGSDLIKAINVKSNLYLEYGRKF